MNCLPVVLKPSLDSRH